jgi:hypothetical protein
MGCSRFSLSGSGSFSPSDSSGSAASVKLKIDKNWFLSSKKYDLGCSSRIPDPDADFLPLSDPGSRGQKDTRSRIRNTEINTGNYQYLASKTYYTGYTKAGTEFLVRLSE